MTVHKWQTRTCVIAPNGHDLYFLSIRSFLIKLSKIIKKWILQYHSLSFMYCKYCLISFVHKNIIHHSSCLYLKEWMRYNIHYSWLLLWFTLFGTNGIF